MSLIEKLDGVLAILNHSDAGPDEMLDTAKELLRDHGPAIRQAMIDAERYRWLREFAYVELQCGSPRITGWVPEQLDAAIDKARATGEGEGNG